MTEVVIALDTSETITDLAHSQSKVLANRIVTHLSISDAANGVRAGIVTFASMATKRIFCDEHEVKFVVG